MIPVDLDAIDARATGSPPGTLRVLAINADGLYDRQVIASFANIGYAEAAARAHDDIRTLLARVRELEAENVRLRGFSVRQTRDESPPDACHAKHPTHHAVNSMLMVCALPTGHDGAHADARAYSMWCDATPMEPSLREEFSSLGLNTGDLPTGLLARKGTP